MPGRSKADAIRQAYADPAVKARVDQDAAGQRGAAARKAAAKVRKIAAKASGAEPGELELAALADEIAALMTLDRPANAAVIREMLPAYLASLAGS